MHEGGGIGGRGARGGGGIAGNGVCQNGQVLHVKFLRALYSSGGHSLEVAPRTFTATCGIFLTKVPGGWDVGDMHEEWVELAD